MSITVNDVEITDTDIEQELPHHTHSPHPIRAAAEALVMRQALLAATRQAGFIAHNPNEEDAIIDRLLAQEVSVPTPTEEECRRYYNHHLENFRMGDLVAVSHILFQVTPTVPLDALRIKAQEILKQVLKTPERFAELAHVYSNCSSSELGGSLGQLARGQTVPEFERKIFSLPPNQVAPRLIETRFGLHIVRIEQRIEGYTLPFEQMRDKLAAYLTERARLAGLKQYLKILLGRVSIDGIDLEGASTPLVQ